MLLKDLYSKKGDCCGCFACANICAKAAIKMEPDNEGFLYPVIDEALCVNCKMCLKVCPVKTAKARIKKEKGIPHIGLVTLNLTHNLGAAISTVVLYHTLKESFNEFEIRTINLNKPLCKTNSAISRLSLTRDEDIKRKQRFYIFRDRFLSKVETIKKADEIDKEINYRLMISGFDIFSTPYDIDKTQRDAIFLNYDVNSKKLFLRNDSVNCQNFQNEMSTLSKVFDINSFMLADKSFYQKMAQSSEIDNSKEKYIFLFLENENNELLEFAKNEALKKGFKLFEYLEFKTKKEANSCLLDGPAEFLNRIMNAQTVVTDCRYCEIISAIFNIKTINSNGNVDNSQYSGQNIFSELIKSLPEIEV